MAGLDFAEYCKGCGVDLPLDRYTMQREWCSYDCYMRDYRAMERAARLDAKRGRPPCAWCGTAMAAERFSTAKYCSLLCQRRAGQERRRQRRPRTCTHCGAAFHANSETQTHCSSWCAVQAVIRKHQPRPCEWCGTMIMQPRRAAAKYCGSTCAARAREAARR